MELALAEFKVKLAGQITAAATPALDQTIRTKVVEKLIEESRPGGLLAPAPAVSMWQPDAEAVAQGQSQARQTRVVAEKQYGEPTPDFDTLIGRTGPKETPYYVLSDILLWLDVDEMPALDDMTGAPVMTPTGIQCVTREQILEICTLSTKTAEADQLKAWLK
jgi:hypothetical protein